MVSIFIIATLNKILFLLWLTKDWFKGFAKHTFIFNMCHTFSSSGSFSHLVSKRKYVLGKFFYQYFVVIKELNEIHWRLTEEKI